MQCAGRVSGKRQKQMTINLSRQTRGLFEPENNAPLTQLYSRSNRFLVYHSSSSRHLCHFSSFPVSALSNLLLIKSEFVRQI